MLIRVLLTLFIILALVATAVVVAEQQLAVAVAAVVALILIAAVWLLGGGKKSRGKGKGKGGKQDELDASAEQLIKTVQSGHDEESLVQIGAIAQKLIVDFLKEIKDKNIRNAKMAILKMQKRSLSKDVESRKREHIAASLAGFYLMADERGDQGFATTSRINNFIAGVKDKSL